MLKVVRSVRTDILMRGQCTSMKRAIDISITVETYMTAFDWIFVFQI